MSQKLWMSEDGVISTEWTLKTGLLAALAASIIPMLTVGIAGMGHKVDARLGTPATVQTSGSVVFQKVVAFDTFGTGWESNWGYSGNVYTDPVLTDGPALLVRDDPTLQQTFTVPENSDHVYIDLDFASIGAFENGSFWSGETIEITINGEVYVFEADGDSIVSAVFDHTSGQTGVDLANHASETADQATIDARMAELITPPNTANSFTGDVTLHRAHDLRIRVDDPGASLDLEIAVDGFSFGDRAGEAIVFNDVRITAVEGDGAGV